MILTHDFAGTSWKRSSAQNNLEFWCPKNNSTIDSIVPNDNTH